MLITRTRRGIYDSSMKFTVTTEKGSQIEFDTEVMSSAVLAFDGVDYEIAIKKV